MTSFREGLKTSREKQTSLKVNGVGHLWKSLVTEPWTKNCELVLRDTKVVHYQFKLNFVSLKKCE